MALLGWSPKGENAEREFFTLSELAEIFEISGISKSPAVFDIEKLRWMNAEYMKKLSPEEFFEKAEPWLKKPSRTRRSIFARRGARAVAVRNSLRSSRACRFH